jgi:transposase
MGEDEGMRVAPSVELSSEERATLTRWARGRRTQARLVVRAKIVLAAAEGRQSQDIALELGVTRRTVGRWRTRFVRKRLEGISKDAPRPGRSPTSFRKHEARILKKTLQTTPSNATHWSTRTLAKELKVSHSLVQRVWKANDVKPHLVRRFKLSNDPRFEEKLRDVVGLYLDPPEHALVLSVDEKSQIQALDRTQPSLPLYNEVDPDF